MEGGKEAFFYGECRFPEKVKVRVPTDLIDKR